MDGESTSVHLAIKSVKQTFLPSAEVIEIMETFRRMVNDCLRIGVENDIFTMKRLSILAYQKLSSYDIVSYYKLCAITHAAGILANRKKSIKRGHLPRNPYARRPLLVSCYGFKIVGGVLKIPLGNRQYRDIQLNSYVRNVLSDPSSKIRSFTLTPDSLSVCYSKEVQEVECRDIAGLDRNLRNVTVADSNEVMQYDLSKAVDIAENTRSIMRSFKRNDVRIRRNLYRKYGLRRRRRTTQLLHRLTKVVVQRARRNKTAIAFEDIRNIRRLYQKGNYQSRGFRAKLNGWSFAEIKRQIEYKAKWEGLPVIQLSVRDTMGTSQHCPQCRKKIAQVDRMTRQLWCSQCERWKDRDIAAAMNLSVKGLARFASSKGLAGEAMKGNLERDPIILRVDASRLAFRHR